MQPLYSLNPLQSLKDPDDRKAEEAHSSTGSESEDDDGQSDDQNEQSNDDSNEVNPLIFDLKPRRHRFESKDDKKEYESLVEEQQHDKRKQKIPKGNKKHLVAKSSGKRYDEMHEAEYSGVSAWKDYRYHCISDNDD
ncbi:hypothetical protein Pst134EA_015826 [Puccinia striiformis f. sp. tritici]|uniref:hypothetical protein n=1 Tax=Puccinia striiformis f. sp. tritici TaxID=168172 RepID=UPI00200778F9|nr:hypothetical protein Pst134EA_015826 [Puccinia striiformis f. sp. tritici]KAH9463740.1 hypothetical protein Pst134EA_015826 [Puccinia striiformis f. sp. tritici]